MENIKRLKTFIHTYKPIHLCWWFEKHGYKIPKYFIGGGSKPPVYASGNIDNATRNLSNTVNTPVTNWTKTNDFIVAIALEAQSGANLSNTNCRLEWRNKTDGGTFAVFSSSGELRLGSTDLVEGNSLDSGETICTPVNGTTYVAGAPNGGVEKETGSTFTVGDGSTANQWSEFQISIDADNALNGKEYEFQVYDVDNSVILGPSLATITMATGATTHYLVGSIDSVSLLSGAINVKRTLIGSTDSLSLLSGNINIDTKLIGSIDSVSLLSGGFNVDIKLIGSADSISLLVGDLTIVGGGITHYLVGSIDSVSLLSGNFNIDIKLIGSANSVSLLSGLLKIINKLYGALNSVSLLSGNIRLITGLSGSLNSNSLLSGILNITRRLEGLINSTSLLTSNLKLINQLVGSLNSLSLLVGNLSIVGEVSPIKIVELTSNIIDQINHTSDIISLIEKESNL